MSSSRCDEEWEANKRGLVDRKNLSLSPGCAMNGSDKGLSLALMTIFAFVFFGLFGELNIQIPNNFPRFFQK